MRRDCGGVQRPVAKGKGPKNRKNAMRRDCDDTQRPVAEEKRRRRSGEAEKRRRGETLHLMILVAQVLELDGGAQLVHYFHAHEEEPVGLCRTGLGA